MMGNQGKKFQFDNCKQPGHWSFYKLIFGNPTCTFFAKIWICVLVFANIEPFREQAPS